jgi:DNA-binding ferritin-like protein (Dps family)
MNLIERLVGDLGQKREYHEYKRRAKALPEPYRTTGSALERYLMNVGVGDDSAVMLTMLDDLATLLEQGAADGTPVRTIVGDDPVEFAEAFLANYPQGSWISKERARLAASISRAVDEAAER